MNVITAEYVLKVTFNIWQMSQEINPWRIGDVQILWWKIHFWKIHFWKIHLWFYDEKYISGNTFLVTGFTPIAPKSCKYVGSKSHSITQHLWYLWICLRGIRNRETLTLTEGFWIELVLSWDVDLRDRSHISGNFPCPVEICLMLALFSNNELT